MKSGLYFSRKSSPKQYTDLKAFFDLDHASTLAVLKKKLEKYSYDFIYVDLKALLSVLRIGTYS